ncbi:MAG: Mth938-like domain-containing protein [Alphaproteobacteria bacterium]
MEILPLSGAGRPVIESYGAGGFRVGGQAHAGSVIVLPDRVIGWPVRDAADVTVASLGPILDRTAELDILVLGCGGTGAPVRDDVRRALQTARVALEVMGTGAACRTFNVLLGEDRRAAAALIAVP